MWTSTVKEDMSHAIVSAGTTSTLPVSVALQSSNIRSWLFTAASAGTAQRKETMAVLLAGTAYVSSDLSNVQPAGTRSDSFPLWDCAVRLVTSTSTRLSARPCTTVP